MLTTVMQKCKNCGHILEFGSTETCPFCEKEENERQTEETTTNKEY